MTDIDAVIAAIRETTAKATPGEWRLDYNPSSVDKGSLTSAALAAVRRETARRYGVKG